MDNQSGLLIVDDEKNILASLNRVLQNEGYPIFTATSGKEGLEILTHENIGVVASDLMMPEMDGVKFLEKVSEIKPDTVQILLTGNASLDIAIEVINRLGLFCFIVKPWKTEMLKSDISRAFDRYRLVSENKRLYRLTVEQNTQLADLNQTLEERVKIRTHLLEEAVDETIFIMARIAEKKDNQAEGHIYRVSTIAFDLCKELGLSDEEAQKISLFSLVHDIGKAAVSDAILKKTDPLTDKERKKFQSHTLAGEEMMGVKPFYQIARQIARSHHEHWDGSGYPDQLRGKDIPLAARIVAVVHEFDALIHSGATKGKPAVFEAIKEIRLLSGIKFDPKIVETFIRMQIARLSQQKPSDDRKAVAAQ
ncbi:MAG: HD domain-containing phosphohydrolase [Thermodesulfobacteriota bacterium]